ncbi:MULTISPECIES: hypothetical protein [unclassified Rhizobium]|uniref:hypothetical protein n=1 Tax=unclassified Rhizobium TaxID=2613769 RepID=UPI0013C4B5FF|nr:MULTISPECIES: hypothetical protein [unclassified Rhizobium]
MNPPAIDCLDAQTAVRRSFQEDSADIKPMSAFGHFFDLESAHMGIFCRNIATIPQENNRRKDNLDDFSLDFDEGWLLHLRRQSLSDMARMTGGSKMELSPLNRIGCGSDAACRVTSAEEPDAA